MSNLIPATEVLADELAADPELRAEWDRLHLARTVAHVVIAYRAEHNLTQTHLARQLGMHQSAIARLESGEHEPSLALLSRLARVLKREFRIEITPDTLHLAG